MRNQITDMGNAAEIRMELGSIEPMKCPPKKVTWLEFGACHPSKLLYAAKQVTIAVAC